MHPRATQGQSHGEQAIERIRGHMRADAACNEHLGSRGGASTASRQALIAAPFSAPPARQADDSGCEASDEGDGCAETDGHRFRNSRHFRNAQIPHNAQRR